MRIRSSLICGFVVVWHCANALRWLIAEDECDEAGDHCGGFAGVDVPVRELQRQAINEGQSVWVGSVGVWAWQVTASSREYAAIENASVQTSSRRVRPAQCVCRLTSPRRVGAAGTRPLRFFIGRADSDRRFAIAALRPLVRCGCAVLAG